MSTDRHRRQHALTAVLALALLLPELFAGWASTIHAAAGYSLTIYSTECADSLLLDGTPITDEQCRSTKDRTFELTGPNGEQTQLATTLEFGIAGPLSRAARYSYEAGVDRSGDWTLTEPGEQPETPTLYECLKSFDGGLVPAHLSYVDGGAEFPWTPAVSTPSGVEGEGLTCTALSRPVNPDHPTAGILRIHAGVAALEDGSDLIVRAAGDEPYSLRNAVGGYVPELTYTLSDADGVEIKLTAPAVDQGSAVTSFPVLPGDYTLTTDLRGTSAPVTIEAGQTVLAFNPLTATFAPVNRTPDPSGGDDAPTPAPDDQPEIFAADIFGYLPSDWDGAYADIDADVYRRDCVALYGADSPNASASLPFSLESVRLGTSELVITGLDDELAGGNPIQIAINGEAVFDDDSPFYEWDPNDAEIHWNRLVVPFDNGLLRVGENKLTVTNLADGSGVGAPPYILLSEAWIFVGLDGGIGWGGGAEYP